jgi:hypothetical protein
MKQVFIGILILVMTSCALMQMSGMDGKINAAKALIVSANNTITADVTSGRITPDEAEDRLTKVAEVTTKLRQVEDFLEIGQTGLAEQHMQALDAGLLLLREYARKQGAT